LLVVPVLVLVLMAASSSGSGVATSDWVCFNKLNGLL
jgi:hypothetical protein